MEFLHLSRVPQSSEAQMMISPLLAKTSHLGCAGVKAILSAIDRILSSTGTQEIDECEPALEALGQIRSSIQGAKFLLSSSPPAARHVIYAALDRQGRGEQLFTALKEDLFGVQSIITTETVSEASPSSLLEYFFNSPPELEGNRAKQLACRECLGPMIISQFFMHGSTVPELIKNLTTCLKKKDDDVAKIILEALRKVTHWNAESRTVEQVAFEVYGLVPPTGCEVEFMVMGWDYTNPQRPNIHRGSIGVAH
ncbi:hypothetical protein D8674_005106 [Pyrus ussuriensis x Pyrus communis]|uniref:Uncharacterized protein n=1 Tax=Pyrus ussuriensis x Pyrus communis TaxID=2448454 RepID=A0A5N5FQH6_9ROSA|nr:hypothetical protein D8674_005106 [Pyrus ussuriensis x Pyrus communis]